MGEVKVEVRVLGVAAHQRLQLEHDKEQQHHCHVFQKHVRVTMRLNWDEPTGWQTEKQI